MRPYTLTNRQGFTLIELLVVISVIAILATLLFPAIGIVKTMANKTKSGNNLKQIATSMHAYVLDASGALPGYSARAAVIAAGVPSRLETLRSFARLSAWSDGDLSGKIFKCPTADINEISVRATKLGTEWDSEVMSYSYDWSAPGENALKTARPIIGDRDPSYWGGKGIQVAFGDAHFEWVRSDTGTGQTVDTDGTALPYTAVYALNSNDDLLLGSDDSGVSNGGDKMNIVARGSSTRAYLK